MDQSHRGVTTHVPGEFVHRADPADIIPTDWTQLRQNRFSVSARWPASHPFFSPVAGARHDPMLVAETIRQTSMLVAHAELGVPLDEQFVMWDLSYSADSEALTVDGLSSDVTVDVVCSDITRRGSRLRNLRTTVVLTRDDRLLATGSGTARCTSALAYRRMRGERMEALGRPVPLIPGVHPRLVGRARTEDVVLAPGNRPDQWQLRVNTAHTTLFRRPNDHVPGMVLLEAARQAATATTGSAAYLPTDLSVSFLRYVELDSPCWIEAESVPTPDPSTTTIRVTGHQDGSPVFRCTLTSPSRELSVATAGLDTRLAG
ncbi:MULTISPECIES: ScbA/BarX family gamma-butyrolactone biosynthesis protein [Streptomyces]|uniref:ScbA protein n=1 Tax=Streptomyces venezuelae (strain ATCC 10712 / CBS 650.69 / DSM 40230 / JCM 4526 / NBRC 13096 / PD 04745) TaxID=953739 RepID=F2RC04_STRVP|nr:ScbA/BarX family gamma-butyrolactone biosynthesis protein [Streptomyces venezuelae]APE24764.1 ScbA protein [Streptomyces venezuelae]QES02114.1 ScbA protein [Streptomyces venezuelae ATCC 10712]CCA59255.1 ScbA protein [Streptomyces venezuelae ATCC 10712]